MRSLLVPLLVLSLLLPGGPPVRAHSAADPCRLALTQLDVPEGLQPSAPPEGDPDEPTDPTVCTRLFQAEAPGPHGVTLVRSLVIVEPTALQALADFKQYAELLEGGGWIKLGALPVGEEAYRFGGADEQLGLFAVQVLARRDGVVWVTEISGVGLDDRPELALNLARVVDRRVAPALATGPRGLPTGSVWPAVAQPTLVAVGLLGDAPLVSQVLGLRLGGFGGLVSLDRQGSQFLAVTGRGPSAELVNGRARALVLPLPAYTPSLTRLELRGGQLAVTSRLGLRLPEPFTDPRTGSAYVTGLPNVETDPAAFDLTGRNRLGTDPYGLDTQGLALDPRDGSYWLCERYGPSIVHVAADGTILARLVPIGSHLSAPGLNVLATLPAELARRAPGRGFEGLAISPDGARMFVIMRGPLTEAASPESASRVVRLLSLALTGPEPRVEGMYLYQTEPAGLVGAGQQDDVRVGDLAAVSQTRLLVAEQDLRETGSFRMIYRVDLAGATNLLALGEVGGRALEQLGPDELDQLGVIAVAKQSLANLADLGWRQFPIAGLALVDEGTVAVIGDDNFGFGGLDQAGRTLVTSQPTRLAIIRLPRSLRE